MNAQRIRRLNHMMTTEQTFSVVDDFLAARPRRNPWDLVDYLSSTIAFFVEVWDGDLHADSKLELVNKFAAQMTAGQLGVAQSQVEDRVETLTGTRDAPTTQANERVAFDSIINNYREFLAAIDTAIENKEKVELVHKAFARGTASEDAPKGLFLPEALEKTKKYSGLGGRRRKTRKSHRRRRVTRRLRR
jgi:hypothetical protein